MPKVNADILTWARETAGFSLEEAARAIGLNDAHGVSGADRLAQLEDGKGEPSRPLLLRMAHKYRRPLIVFYLDRRPPTGDRGQDFRTLPGKPAPEYDANLDALIRDVRARHALLKSVLEDEDARPLSFVGSHRISAGPAAVAKGVCSTTGFDLKAYRARSNVDDAFSYLRSRLEGAGIFVLLIGNLGSHHSNIGPRAFRGFAIADPIAPTIVINDQDARSAWPFTGLHEAAHLWLGTSGISGSFAGQRGKGGYAESQIERFCNEVAGRILLPIDELRVLEDLRTAPFDHIIDRISNFAKERNISRRMVAYQLLRADTIDGETWALLNDRFDEDYLASKAKSRERESAVSFYVVRRHRLGRALIGVVSRALAEGSLTYTKAAQLLGVKPGTVEPLLRVEPARGSA